MHILSAQQSGQLHGIDIVDRSPGYLPKNFLSAPILVNLMEIKYLLFKQIIQVVYSFLSMK